MDYPSLKRLYSIARVLSTITKGDSLTDIQYATRLSFQTVIKTVNQLESLEILSTDVVKGRRGKTREIVYISEDYKEISVFFKRILQKFDSAVNEQEEETCSSLLFEAQLLSKCEKEVKNCLEYQFSSKIGEIFWEWMENGTISDSLKNSISKEEPLMSSIPGINEKDFSFSVDLFSVVVDLNREETKISKDMKAQSTV